MFSSPLGLTDSWSNSVSRLHHLLSFPCPVKRCLWTSRLCLCLTFKSTDSLAGGEVAFILPMQLSECVRVSEPQDQAEACAHHPWKAHLASSQSILPPPYPGVISSLKPTTVARTVRESLVSGILHLNSYF